MTKENIDLAAVRDQLLHLHKLLLEHQRRDYSEKFRKVPTPNEMYGLVVSHPDFQWLRALSEVIVSIDEALEDKESKINKDDLVSYLRKLIAPDEQGNEFSQKYHDALQNFPEALVCHGKLIQYLKM